jgi:hypothetical protein
MTRKVAFFEVWLGPNLVIQFLVVQVANAMLEE